MRTLMLVLCICCFSISTYAGEVFWGPPQLTFTQWSGKTDKHGNYEEIEHRKYIDRAIYNHQTQNFILMNGRQIVCKDHATKLAIRDGVNIYRVIHDRVHVINPGMSKGYTAKDRLCDFNWKGEEIILEPNENGVTVIDRLVLEKIRKSQEKDFKEKEAIHKKHACCRATLPIPEDIGPVKVYTQPNELNKPKE